MARPPIQLDVAAALIQDADGRYLITQRRRGSHLEGLWEFPGGKRDAGEELTVCLVRELREELGARFTVGEKIDTIEWEYPDRTIVLHFYRCRLAGGAIEPREQQAMAWVAPTELSRYDFPPADRELISRLAAGPREGGHAMAPTWIRELYDYHRWANRRLFDVALGLGEGLTRDMGKHWSVPTVKGMFAHLYSADALWLARWKGAPPDRTPFNDDFATMADLRARWDELEAEQRTFVESLDEAALAKPLTYKNTTGTEFAVPLAPLLQHVVNHATHHRSELCTMITLISGSPPDTGINTYRTSVVKG